MTVTVRAVATVASGGSPLSCPKPSGTLEGDLLLLQVSLHANISPTSLPSGFTLVPSAEIASADNVRIYSKVAGASEPSTYDVSFATSQGSLGCIALYSSGGASLQFDGVSTQTNSSSANRVWASVTTTLANTLLCMFAALEGATGTTPPGGASEQWDVDSNPRIYLMTEAIAAIGATGTRTGTGNVTGSRCVAIAVAELVTAGADITLGAVTLSAAGTVDITGEADIVLGAVTSSAAGATPPATPTSFTATAISASRIDLSWAQSGSDYDGFSLERSLTGVGAWSVINTLDAADRAYSDVGLADNTTYYYRMRSFRN